MLSKAASASGVKVTLLLGAGVGDTVAVAVDVGGTAVGDAVAVAVVVGLGPIVGVDVAVGGIGVEVAVTVTVGVGLGPGVGVAVGVRLPVTSAAKVPRVNDAVLRPLICSVWPLLLTLAALSQQAGLPLPEQSAGLPTWSKACCASTSALQAALSSTGMLSVQVAPPEVLPRAKTS